MVPPVVTATLLGVAVLGVLAWHFWKFFQRPCPPARTPSESPATTQRPRGWRDRIPPPGDPERSTIDKALLRRHLEWFFSEIKHGRTEINGFLIQDPATIVGLRCVGLESASDSGRVLCDLAIDESGISELDTSNFDTREARHDLRKTPLLKCFVNHHDMGLVYFDGARYQSRSLTDRTRELPVPPKDSLRRSHGLTG